MGHRSQRIDTHFTLSHDVLEMSPSRLRLDRVSKEGRSSIKLPWHLMGTREEKMLAIGALGVHRRL